MRVGLIAFGSRGDFQPFLALALALRDRGLTPIFAAHEQFVSVVRDHGIEARVLPGDVQKILDSPEGHAWLDSGTNPVSFVRRGVALVTPIIDDFCSAVADLIEEVDAVVFAPTAAGAHALARRLDIPCIMAGLQPWTPTGDHPAPLLGLRSGFGRIGNRLSGHLFEQLMWQPIRHLADRWGRRRFGKSPFPTAGSLRQVRLDEVPVLYAFSEHVVDRPRDWGSHIDMTGYWFLDHPADYVPPPDLQRFLDAGPPPIYVGFGSMTEHDPATLLRTVLDGVAQAGVRCVLSRGWMNLGHQNLPENVHPIGPVPHDWLFPRMSAIVHHGGAGTTATALRAGVPSIVVPFFSDQTFWAHRVERLGAGPASIPKRRLTAAALASAVRDVTPTMREAARRIGGRLHAERGAERAARAIARMLERSG